MWGPYLASEEVVDGFPPELSTFKGLSVDLSTFFLADTGELRGSSLSKELVVRFGDFFFLDFLSLGRGSSGCFPISSSPPSGVGIGGRSLRCFTLFLGIALSMLFGYRTVNSTPQTTLDDNR